MGIGPVNLLMAHGARTSEDLVAVRGVAQQEPFVDLLEDAARSHDTPLAEERQLGLQHAVVVTAMRIVAGHARVRDGYMRLQVWTTLFSVTAGARSSCVARLEQRTLVDPCTLWQEAHSEFAFAHRHGLKRFSLLVTFLWQVAHCAVTDAVLR